MQAAGRIRHWLSRWWGARRSSPREGWNDVARPRAGQGRRPFAAAGHVCAERTLGVCSTKRMRDAQLGFGLARAGQVRRA